MNSINKFRNFYLKYILISGFILLLILFGGYVISEVNTQIGKLESVDDLGNIAKRPTPKPEKADKSDLLPARPQISPIFDPMVEAKEHQSRTLRSSEIEKQKKLIGLFNGKEVFRGFRVRGIFKKRLRV